MNTSQFMDKQIMDLSNSQNNSTFMDLTNLPPQEDHHHVDGGGGGEKKDEILPNYDFQPIRPAASSQSSKFDCSDVDGTRVWNSAESKINSSIRNYGSLDAVLPSNVIMEKDRDVYDAALISEIDRTMKKHADNLMHALEGVSARLSQLESRSRHLENSVEDLKVSVGNNHGSTDGKLRQIENIVREVQAGVQVVKDKQEILEAQLQLSKVQTLKVDQQSETQIHGQQQQHQAAASPPLQSDHHLPPAAPLPQSLPPPAAQNLAPIHHPNQFPQHYPPSGQTPEAPPPHYQIPPPQQQQPQAAPPPHPQYQPPPQHIQYSQPPPMPQQHPSANQPQMGHHSEEPTNLQPQTYPPSIRQTIANPPPPKQFYGSPSQMYEQPSSRPGSGFSGPYGPSSGYTEPYAYGGGSPRKSQQYSSPNVGPGPGYPQLPTARILSHTIPTASAVTGGSGSGSGSGPQNRVPIDDVVDKVTTMGFPRDQVRATVRKLTEDGQAVDLNVVLDKVMNDGVESQGPRGWFGR